MTSFRICFSLLAGFLAAPLFAADFFVSPSGRDDAAGTAAAPFASVTRARDAVRALRASGPWPTAGVTVWLHGGVYALPATLELDGRDAGSAGQVVTYAGWPGEQVQLSGAAKLDPARFALVDSSSPIWSRVDAAARGHLWATDLRAQGVTDFGTFRPRGFSLHANSPLELSINGQAMRLGRWPNLGATLARTASAPSARQITFNGGRAARWTHANEIWMHGLWSQGWADYHLAVASLVSSTGTVTFSAAPDQYGLAADRPFYAYNLLEEIDEPGEYYVDRTSCMLYVWPQVALNGALIQVSQLESPIVRATATHHITLRNLIIEAGRGSLVDIEQSDSVRVEQCVLRNAGGVAAIVDGSRSGLDQCEVLDAGEEGARLFGGDRATLTSAGNFVVNSHLSRAGRLSWAYKAAVSLEGGCGSEVSHNLMEDLPHAAILFNGNNHLISYNEIQRACALTSDAGAIYTSRGWTTRGNALRFNFIHHVASTEPGGAHGIYLDDCASGIEVTGNVLYRIADRAIFCGGGRDNLIRSNVIAASGVAHFNDDRGRFRADLTPGSYWNLLERLSDDGVKYQQAPWSTAFPACAAIPNSWAQVQSGLWRNPQGTVFSQNVGWANDRWTVEDNASGTGVFAVYAAFSDNQSGVTPLFDESTSLNRSLRATSLGAGLAGFTAIPFSAIGQPSPAVLTPPNVAGSTSQTVRIEAEDNLDVANDVGGNGSVGVSGGNLDSGDSVRLYDTGDAVRISFSAPTSGNYRLAVRVRSGGTTGATVFWPDGYRFKLDGAKLSLTGQSGTLSLSDPAFGGCYWGTMTSESISLSAGRHVVEVAAATNWCVVDYLEVTSDSSAASVPVAATPPSLVLPADQVVEASGPNGATVTFSTGAVSGLGASLTAQSTPASGSLFPIGTSTVQVSATDAGLAVSGQFKVTVRDTTPPQLTVPASLITSATNPAGAVLSFTAAATDLVNGACVTTLSPASGSLFPVGVTQVQVSSSDRSGNVAAQTFSVTVLPLPLLAPASVTAKLVGGKIFIEWQAAAGASGYDVKRATTQNGPYTLVASNLSSLSFVDVSAVLGSTYYYVVSARSLTQVSNDSAWATMSLAPVGAEWASVDIGAASPSGGSNVSGTNLSVTGGGPDIWGRADAFHLLSKEQSGDGGASVRLTSLQITDEWAKAGVMIRASQAADAPFAILALTPAHGIVLQWRNVSGGDCNSIDGGGATYPCYLSLQRVGKKIIGSRSSDGSNWREVGRVDVDLNDTARLGLAVTSHTSWSTNTATFDSWTLNPSTARVLPIVSHLEAEAVGTVLHDVGGNGSVGISDSSSDSGQSVRLYDVGDALRIPFLVPTTGNYVLRMRVRSGGSTGSGVFWPSGYGFAVDGVGARFTGDSSSLSDYDSGYGGCYWGTMNSESVSLSAGAHFIDVTANSAWAVVDYFELASDTTL